MKIRVHASARTLKSTESKKRLMRLLARRDISRTIKHQISVNACGKKIQSLSLKGTATAQCVDAHRSKQWERVWVESMPSTCVSFPENKYEGSARNQMTVSNPISRKDQGVQSAHAASRS